MIPSHSFLLVSALDTMFISNMAAINTASIGTHFLWLNRTVTTGVTKALMNSLGLCLLILQCVAHFNYQFPFLSNSHSLILKLRLKISSCIMYAKLTIKFERCVSHHLTNGTLSFILKRDFLQKCCFLKQSAFWVPPPPMNIISSFCSKTKIILLA